jgi:hypothetical protein
MSGPVVKLNSPIGNKSLFQNILRTNLFVCNNIMILKCIGWNHLNETGYSPVSYTLSYNDNVFGK